MIDLLEIVLVLLIAPIAAVAVSKARTGIKVLTALLAVGFTFLADVLGMMAAGELGSLVGAIVGCGLACLVSAVSSGKSCPACSRRIASGADVCPFCRQATGKERAGAKEPGAIVLREDLGATKTCPFCAETIRAEAIKCRYCGSELRAPV